MLSEYISISLNFVMPTCIGVLALQGAFFEHQQHIDRLRSAAGLDVETRLVKTVEDLEVSIAE